MVRANNYPFSKFWEDDRYIYMVIVYVQRERESESMAVAEPSSCCRKVLITGVSKGLGRALALELANRGHTIIGCSRDQVKLDSLQQQLSTTSLNQHFFFKLDVVYVSQPIFFFFSNINKRVSFKFLTTFLFPEIRQ